MAHELPSRLRISGYRWLNPLPPDSLSQMVPPERLVTSLTLCPDSLSLDYDAPLSPDYDAGVYRKFRPLSVPLF